MTEGGGDQMMLRSGAQAGSLRNERTASSSAVEAARASSKAARQFWVFWTASTTSGLGTAVTVIALPLTALNVLGASALQMGCLSAASYVGWLLLTLPAGVIVRKLPLRGLLVSLDIIRGTAMVSVPAAWWLGLLTFGQLVVVALVVALAKVLHFVAEASFLPLVVPREQLQARNSLISGTQAVTELGGRPFGGLLVQLLGSVLALLADALSYLLSACLLHRLDAGPQPRRDEPAKMRQQIREGLRFVMRNRVMRTSMWEATATNFVAGAQLALFPIYVVRDLGASPGVAGILLGAEAVGTILAATWCAHLVCRLGSARLCLLAGVVSCLGAFLIPLGAGWVGFAAFAAGSIISAAGTVVRSITTRTYRQLASPPDMLPRVMATVRFVSWGVIPVGSLVAGALAQGVGSRTALVVFAVVTLLSPLILFFSPIRVLRDFPDQTPAE